MIRPSFDPSAFRIHHCPYVRSITDPCVLRDIQRANFLSCSIVSIILPSNPVRCVIQSSKHFSSVSCHSLFRYTRPFVIASCVDNTSLILICFCCCFCFLASVCLRYVFFPFVVLMCFLTSCCGCRTCVPEDRSSDGCPALPPDRDA